MPSVQYLVVAGGGGGASGGGGAGGFRTNGVYNYSIVAGTYTVTVGGGGPGATGGTGAGTGTKGTDSVFDTITSEGGGGGGRAENNGANGGSGGGAGASFPAAKTGGTGTVGQGNNGGSNPVPRDAPYSSAGGGGASAAGQNPPANNTAGNGGDGTASSISGSSVTYSGGGGGGIFTSGSGTPGTGGAGGGANGKNTGAGNNGTANTGGGGGGTCTGQTGGTGGSGRVIIRYLTSDFSGFTVTGGAKTTDGLYTVHDFTTSGSLVVTAVPAPVADFTGTPTSGTVPLTVQFTDSSTNTPTSWSWTFGDGGTSTTQNPSYQYAAAGTYTVALQATNAGGSNTKTRTNYITVSAAVTVDTHDGFDGKQQRKKNEEFKRYNERLRQDLKEALEGPKAKEIREELKPYVKPTESKPFWQSLDIERLSQRISELVVLQAEFERLEMAREAKRLLDEDDQEVLALVEADEAEFVNALKRLQ